MNAKCELDNARNAIGFAYGAIVGKRLGVAAREFHQTERCCLPMMPRSIGRTGLVCCLSDARKVAMFLVLAFSLPKKLCKRDVRRPVSARTAFLLRGAGHAAKFGDEFTDGDVAAMSDVCRHVTAEAA